MIRIQVNLNKPAGDQPKTIYPTNFFVDFENGKLELRDLTKEDVEKFCEKYGLILSKEYKKTLDASDGAIIGQSRNPGDIVTSSARLTITIAKTPEELNPTPEEKTEETE